MLFSPDEVKGGGSLALLFLDRNFAALSLFPLYPRQFSFLIASADLCFLSFFGSWSYVSFMDRFISL